MVEELTPLWSQLCRSLEQSHGQLISQVQELMAWATQYLGKWMGHDMYLDTSN